MKPDNDLIGKIKLKNVLHNAHRHLGRRYRKMPLWAFVVDMCGVGSTSACAICKAFGWDPNQDGGRELIWTTDE